MLGPYLEGKIMIMDISVRTLVSILSAVIMVQSQLAGPSENFKAQSSAPLPDLSEYQTNQPESNTSTLIKSIDVMKRTRDRVCSPSTDDEIATMIERIKNANATHVAISFPIDQTYCNDPTPQMYAWVKAAREQGLQVWFRLVTNKWEGFYETQKHIDPYAHTRSMANFVTSHPDLFLGGDILTPFPEPQNGGIAGVNCFDGNCMFDSASSFNTWLRHNQSTLENAVSSIGKADVKVGYYGFDGFVAWGDRNPDWIGILETNTITEIGDLTFDHYFPTSDDPVAEFAKIKSRFPDTELCVGEWGSIHGESPERINQVLQAAYDAGIRCFNYWHLGPDGVSETLINHDFSPNDRYYAVQEFYGKY